MALHLLEVYQIGARQTEPHGQCPVTYAASATTLAVQWCGVGARWGGTGMGGMGVWGGTGHGQYLGWPRPLDQ